MKNIKAFGFGIGLLMLEIIIFTSSFPGPLDVILKLALGFLRIALLFYCTNLVKAQNRSIVPWSFFAFLFPGIAAMILSTLSPLNSIYYYDTKPDLAGNPNGLPERIIPVNSLLTLEAIKNSPFTLRNMIADYKRYSKDYTDAFVVLAAFELNKRGEKFDEKLKSNLNSFANEKGYNSFEDLLSAY